MWDKVVDSSDEVLNELQHLDFKNDSYEVTLTTSSDGFRKLALRAALLNGKRIIGFSWYARNWASSHWYPTRDGHCYFDRELFGKLIKDTGISVIIFLQQFKHGDNVHDSDSADNASAKRKRGRPRKADSGEHAVENAAKKKHRESPQDEDTLKESQEDEDWSK